MIYFSGTKGGAQKWQKRKKPQKRNK